MAHNVNSNPIERLNSWLVQKLTGKQKYASVSYRYMCKSLERELRSIQSNRARMLALFSLPSPLPAINLAMFMGFSLASELNARVLIVDTVIRARYKTLSRRFGQDNEPGFYQLCSNPQTSLSSVVQPTALRLVDLLPSGQFEYGNGIIIDHDRLTARLTEMATKYDYVIFTQADIREDTRYMAISERVDLNLLVVQENRSFMHDIEELHKLFRDSDLHNLKLIMTT